MAGTSTNILKMVCSFFGRKPDSFFALTPTFLRSRSWWTNSGEFSMNFSVIFCVPTVFAIWVYQQHGTPWCQDLELHLMVLSAFDNGPGRAPGWPTSLQCGAEVDPSNKAHWIEEIQFLSSIWCGSVWVDVWHVWVVTCICCYCLVSGKSCLKFTNLVQIRRISGYTRNMTKYGDCFVLIWPRWLSWSRFACCVPRPERVSFWENCFSLAILSTVPISSDAGSSNCPLRANAAQKWHETPERLQEANLFSMKKRRRHHQGTPLFQAVMSLVCQNRGVSIAKESKTNRRHLSQLPGTTQISDTIQSRRRWAEGCITEWDRWWRRCQIGFWFLDMLLPHPGPTGWKILGLIILNMFFCSQEISNPCELNGL